MQHQAFPVDRIAEAPSPPRRQLPQPGDWNRPPFWSWDFGTSSPSSSSLGAATDFALAPLSGFGRRIKECSVLAFPDSAWNKRAQREFSPGRDWTGRFSIGRRETSPSPRLNMSSNGLFTNFPIKEKLFQSVRLGSSSLAAAPINTEFNWRYTHVGFELSWLLLAGEGC